MSSCGFYEELCDAVAITADQQGLQEVTAPSQEITWDITPHKIASFIKHVFFLFLHGLNKCVH